jgi:hypothetical protein
MDTLSILHRSLPAAVKLMLLNGVSDTNPEEAVVAASGVSEELAEVERVAEDVQRRMVVAVGAGPIAEAPAIQGIYVGRPREDGGLKRSRARSSSDSPFRSAARIPSICSSFFPFVEPVPVVPTKTRWGASTSPCCGLSGYPAGLREEDAEVADRRLLPLGHVDVDAVEVVGEDGALPHGHRGGPSARPTFPREAS